MAKSRTFSPFSKYKESVLDNYLIPFGMCHVNMKTLKFTGISHLWGKKTAGVRSANREMAPSAGAVQHQKASFKAWELFNE